MKRGGRELAWCVVAADGAEVEVARLWLSELVASDYSPSTLRAYAYDLLSWLRFLDAIEVSWRQATRSEVRDWVRWHQLQENPQRRRGRTQTANRPPAGSINSVTGKPYLADSYARATINRMLSSLSGFHEFAISAGLGPLAHRDVGERGERPGATRLGFTAGDRVQAQVDVGNGNLQVTVEGLTLAGVEEPTTLGAYYNSAASQATPVPRLGRGWDLNPFTVSLAIGFVSSRLGLVGAAATLEESC